MEGEKANAGAIATALELQLLNMLRFDSKFYIFMIYLFVHLIVESQNRLTTIYALGRY